MSDDPTGRSKPPAKRPRKRRTTASAAPATAPETVDPTSVDDPSTSVEDGSEGIVAVPVEPVVAGSGDGWDADAGIATADGANAASAWPMLDDHSPNEWVCPFLRAVDEHDHLGSPIETPDPANRCAALEDVVPQSLRQQELVCLTTSHVNCPRYLRGAVVAVDPAAAKARTAPSMTPAMVAALAVLAAAFSASVGFTLARGGLDLPVAGAPASAGPSSSAVAVVATASPSAAASIVATPSPSVSVAPSDTPVPTATPTPSATPAATPAPTPKPTSDRYALLRPCPDKPDCWLYRVRSGDNLFSIAKYFGVPLATVKSLNPWTANGLKVGRDLILPPPTR